jgi:hypothetical protein
MRSLRVLMIVAAALVMAGAASALDSDRDGIADSRDNCPAVANPDQLDSNRDGAGNLCDFDYNEDGRVDEADAALLKAAVGVDENNAAFGYQYDADGDGLISGSDWALFVAAFKKG